MHLLFFIISLGVVLVAAWIFENSADEISYLAASISIVGLLVSLVLAPWEIKVLLLALVLLRTRRLSLPSTGIVEPKLDKQVKLLDRGDTAIELPAAEANKGEVTGKYRGQVWKAGDRQEATASQPTYQIKYRGASLTNKPSAQPAVEQTVEPKNQLSRVS